MIIGHTDKQASNDYNMQLSRERAESVKEYLVSQGIAADKLVTKGMGETDPIADNSTEQGRFRNRRIEFVVYDESSMASEGTITGNTAFDPDLNPLDSNNDDLRVDGDDRNVRGANVTTIDPDLNPLDSNNDDLLPDSDDPSRGTVLDPKANMQ